MGEKSSRPGGRKTTGFNLDEVYQWKQKLLDDEIYRSWLSDLEDVVQKHNLEVFSSGIQNVFVGDFGRHLSQLRAKVYRNAV